MAKAFFLIGTISAFLAVAGGAFGAHGLKTRISPEMLEIYQTGIQYQFYHALALLVLALFIQTMGNNYLLQTGGLLFILGIILFSGSLFTLSLTGVKWLGAITPFGGIGFLAGWVCFLIGGWKAFS